jgi:hypothetical protein
MNPSTSKTPAYEGNQGADRSRTGVGGLSAASHVPYLRDAQSALLRSRKRGSVMRRLLPLVLALVFAAPAGASHYLGAHWYRPPNYPTMPLVNDFSSLMGNRWEVAASKWNPAATVQMGYYRNTVGAYTACEAGSFPDGEIRACSHTYGINGWLGLATWWNWEPWHLQRGTVKINQSYPMPDQRYVNVTCHELGHGIGLAHYNSSLSCMNNIGYEPGNPSSHDFYELDQWIYWQPDYEQTHLNLSHNPAYVTTECSNPCASRAVEVEVWPVDRPNFAESENLRRLFDQGASFMSVRLLDGSRISEHTMTLPDGRRVRNR